MANEKNKKWETEKLGFQPVTNDDLVCHNCIYVNPNIPVGKCKKYQVKPDKVLLGGECDEHKIKE